MDFRVEINEDEAIRWINRHENRARRRIRDTLDDIADVGVLALNLNVPEFSTYTLRHIDREPVRWFPGGLGGGGEYGAVVGIKQGTSRHPIYAELGTGIYARPSEGYITPIHGQYLSFYSFVYGRRIRLRRVRGQKPQRYFYRSWRELNIYARARVARQSF